MFFAKISIKSTFPPSDFLTSVVIPHFWILGAILEIRATELELREDISPGGTERSNCPYIRLIFILNIK